jgi:hypothetical protein
MPYKLQICIVIPYTRVACVYRFKSYIMPLEIKAIQIDRICSVMYGSGDHSATDFTVANMKNVAMNFLTILLIKSMLSLESEISVTSRYNIIKSVKSKYHSTCVYFLYSTKYQGASMILLLGWATEQCLHIYP